MARIVIEERAIGDERWGVFIHRDDRILNRTLWNRYPSQNAAMAGAKIAKAYLEGRGETVTSVAA